ncbi:hypothetical protein DBR36_00340 [Microbacterium sp. HMWF026]|uniref:hypothetical protein n=1 Tax=Microbacterium sp. HMWF026 TaxID=2056861 RepID=UPI000D33584E|nr:hypothetical protein [Microbacterium sp. HMWF026]PTT23166.1 hypothetical protein DBR36_00340 [Microbacterium sp. HMWF026]
MTRARGSLRPVLALALVVVGALGAAAPALAASGAESGTPLTVSITDGSTPAPSSSTSTGSSVGGSSTGGSSSGGSGVSNGSRGSSGTTGGVGTGDAGAGTAGETTPTGEVNVGGGIFVGGLNGSGAPSVNPVDGTVDLWFTVRNASSTAIDATAQFWMDAPVFASRLDGTGDVAITGLQPGESRVVSATLHGAGQWTLVSTHVSFTPPETVSGEGATSVTRDALVLVFPWLLVLVAVVLALGVLVVRVVRSALPPAPVAAMP